MTLAVLVQARTSSARFPGKVLAPLAGRPVLEWLLLRLGSARIPDVVMLATSNLPADDAIATLGARCGIPVHRGPLDDVASRMADAAEATGARGIIRVSGDSPLLDPALVDRAANLWLEAGADLVTNVNPRSYPVGQSVEVIGTEALRAALPGFGPTEREHVTTWFYARQDHYRIRNFSSGQDWGAVRLAVDDPADLARLESVLRVVNPLTAGVAELARVWLAASPDDGERHGDG